MAYTLITIICNIYFHPLSKFPGPKVAAATKFPIAYMSWKGELSHWFRKLHEEYNSDVVRTSPDELSIISPEAWKDLYGLRPGHKNIPKDMRLHVGIDSIVTAKDADHSRLRRVLAHAFSDKALKEQEPLIQSHVDMFLGQLEKQSKDPSAGKPNFADWYNWYTFDVICDLSFGQSFDCVKDKTYHPWVAYLLKVLQAVVFLSVCQRFPPLDRLLVLMVPKSALVAIRDHKKKSADFVDQRIDSETDRIDFHSYILKHNDEKGMTRHELHENAATLIGAGGETSSGLLAGATYLLLTHPAAYQKVMEEVRGSFQQKTDINISEVAKLPYFEAVLKESFRMYPPAIFGQPRRTYAAGETVAGYWIPKNTGLQLNQYAANYSASNFTDPERFAPERWLGDAKYKDDHREGMQPFSIGVRNCIGRQ
jgi:cytochrome P450